MKCAIKDLGEHLGGSASPSRVRTALETVLAENAGIDDDFDRWLEEAQVRAIHSISLQCGGGKHDTVCFLRNTTGTHARTHAHPQMWMVMNPEGSGADDEAAEAEAALQAEMEGMRTAMAASLAGRWWSS
jgi:hypothetical protein